jgi:hypothetical protein
VWTLAARGWAAGTRSYRSQLDHPRPGHRPFAFADFCAVAHIVNVSRRARKFKYKGLWRFGMRSCDSSRGTGFSPGGDIIGSALVTPYLQALDGVSCSFTSLAVWLRIRTFRPAIATNGR